MCVFSIDRLCGCETENSRKKMVIALGNFDGVHIGHAKILSGTVALAKELGATAAVWMFVPHPAVCLSGDPLPLITTFEERKAVFASLGITYAVSADFPSFRTMPKQDFLCFLRDKLGCVGAVCGYNYSFGDQGLGSSRDIAEFFGSSALIVPEMRSDEEHVSSSQIRALIAGGQVDVAERMLGRPFSVGGKVESGRHIGRTIDFPTANLVIPMEKIAPATGIYATATLVDGVLYPSVTNFGTNPTVTDLHAKKLETHIVGFCGDLYGCDIRVFFYEKLREEKKFSSLDELKSAITNDCENAKRVYALRGEKM